MDFGLERTKGTFNPDVLPRRRTVGSPVIRHCFVLVPPFVSLLNVQLARALRSLFRYRDDYSINSIVMITRSRELQLEETLLKRGSIKIQYLRKFEGRVTRFGRKPEKYIDRCVPFFLHSSLTCFVLCPRLRKYRGGGFARWQGEGKKSGRGRKPYGFPSTSSNRCSVP